MALFRAVITGVRERPLPADIRAGEETAREVLLDEEAQAERLSALSRLLAAGGGMLLAAMWALSGTAPPGVGLGVVALAVVSTYAVVIMWSQWRGYNPGLGYLGMAADVLMLGAYLALLSLWYQWPGGSAAALHFPAWLFFVVIIAGNALSFRQGRIVAAAVLSVAVTVGLALFAARTGGAFGDLVNDFSGPDLSVAGVATRVVVLALVAALLAQSAVRARSTIKRAANAEAAAATFGRYFSPKVAQRLLTDMGGKLEGQRVDATIIQSDVRGFTTFSESMSPEDILKLLNTYFDAMLEILFKHDGTVIGFQGDGMLAAFGVPEARPGDADRALQAVREMLQKVDEMSTPGGAAPGLKIGVALHSGVVVAGNLGSKRRMEYTVLGDTVNTTARIESLNKELGTRLLITEATIRRLSTTEGLYPVGHFELRGRAEPVQLYTPEALVPVAV
jgi:adenylate cyclase